MTTSSVPRVQTHRKAILPPVGWAILFFLLALIPRLPGLRLFLTSDERTNLYWAGSQFVEGLVSGDLSLTYWHFYPGVTMSWLEAAGLTGYWALARFTGATTETLTEFVRRPILDLILAARLPYALLTAGGVAGFYLLARRLLGHRTAVLGALFITFDPFYLAHSRVAHGDAPVTVFMGLSALAFFVYAREASLHRSHGVTESGGRWASRKWWLILSAVMGALAALTKAPGQFMALFVVLVAVGDWLVVGWQMGRLDWRLAGRWVVDLVLWGGVAALLFVALWPVMWVDPAGTLLRMLAETFGKVEEGHLVFFMGQPTLDPGPWFYPYVIAFRMTPITLIGIILSAVLILIRWVALTRRQDEESRLQNHYVVAVLLWFYVVSLLLFGNLSSKKQDRYLLPLLPILDLLAAFAYVQIIESASRQIGRWKKERYAIRGSRYALVLALSVLLLLIHAFPVVTAYPYYLAYFNPLMGGLPRAIQTTLVGWGEGMEQAAAYLNRLSDADKLYVAAVPAQTFLPYFRGEGENFYTNDVAMRADYVILYVSQIQRLAPSPEIVNYFLATEPEHTVYVGDVPYARIYPGPKLVTTSVPPDATQTNIGFGDQLRLAGYQVSDLESHTSNLDVVLYWHALSSIDTDYTVSVRLVAPDGDWLVQRDSWPADGLLPTGQWRPGDYVRDAHSLTLPAELGTGMYTVQVVVYDTATGAALNEPQAVVTVATEATSP